MRQTDRQTDRQTALKICLNFRRIWHGIPFALLCVILCWIGGASRAATVVLPAVFLVIAIFEVHCHPILAKILTILWGVAGLFATVFTSQLLLNESTFSLGLQRILLNMAICGVVMGFIYVATARLRLSVIVGMFALLLFTASNYFVFKFRGSELCPADFLSIGTAAAVADRYTFSVDAPFVYAVILAMLFACAVFCVKESPESKIQKGRRRVICAAVVSVLLLTVAFGIENIVANHFLQTGSVRNGYLLNFVLEIEESIIKKPSGYSNDAILQMEENSDTGSNNAEGADQPIIIVIMNESFADLSVLGNEIHTNIDVLPFFDSMADNTIRGYALSSVIGGGTANSEYEFLSGNTMGFLPSGSIVYQQFIQNEPYTLIPYMNELGYTTIATHPEDEKNWLRYSVYPKMGFDDQYFINDYPGENLMRGFISDQEMYEQIIDWYESCLSDEKMFLFGITMQNHGFYYYEGDDFQNTVQLEGYVGDYPDVEQYLTVLHESDKALKYLIEYFESVDRDVIILFYGDHYPKLSTGFYEEVHGGTFDSLDEQMLQYTVPFFIWANFDIEEQYVELTSLNFLSNLLLETAGLELPAYNEFLADVQEVIPAMNSFGYYSKAQGKFVPYDKATGIEAEMLQQYQILQYNCIFDEENKSDVFFPCYTDD